MKIISTTGLTELIQLTKDNFIDKSNTIQATTVQLATVALTGSYTDLTNKPVEIPSQTGQSGKFLTTDGTTLSWATGGGGSVYSPGTNIDITNNTISTSAAEVIIRRL